MKYLCLVPVMVLVASLPVAAGAEFAQEQDALLFLEPSEGAPSIASGEPDAGQSPETSAPETLESIPTPAAPAPEDRQETPRKPRNVLVEEIVVTAQKREENVQDVPIAVSAFSADQLSVLGIEDTKDLALVTPGLQFSEMAGFTLIYLRGVGTDSFLPYSDPSVATYVDGLYIPAQQGLVNSFGGVERVEVLKGPQGTLFGRNSTGGAISVITRSPGDEAQATAQFELGNLGTRKAQVYASFPILETLAASVSGIYNHVDSYYTLVTDDLGPADSPPEGPILDEESRGVRVKLRWYPSDDIDLSLAAYRIEQEGSGSLVAGLREPSPLATLFGIEPEQRDYAVHKNEDSRLRVVNSALSASARWTLPWFDLKLIGGYQDILTKNARYDYDFSAKDLVSFYTFNAYNHVTTAEFQIASNDQSWSADRFKWIGGLYYLHSVGGYDPISFEAGGIPPVLPGAALVPPDILPQLMSRVPFLGRVPGVDPADGDVKLDIYGVLETNSRSVFLQGSWDWTDWFSTTAGGRYQEEDRFLIDQRVASRNADGSSDPVFNYNEPKVRQYNFSPKISLDFRPMDDVLVYTSYTKGYKSGTYNGIAIYTEPSYVDPERVDAYEIGVKSTWLGGNLRLNAAVFQSETQDLQVTFVSLTNGGAITFENAGEARTRGAEMDLMWVAMPELNPGLVLTTGVSYLDSVFMDYRNASGYDETTGLFFSRSRDFSGNRVPRSPEWSGNLGLNQLLDFALGPVELGVDLYYNGGFFYTAQNTETARQAAYSLLNARASWTYQPWNLKLTIFGQNLDDETYSYGGFTEDFGTGYTLAPPRTYGVRMNWEF